MWRGTLHSWSTAKMLPTAASTPDFSSWQTRNVHQKAQKEKHPIAKGGGFCCPGLHPRTVPEGSAGAQESVADASAPLALREGSGPPGQP